MSQVLEELTRTPHGKTLGELQVHTRIPRSSLYMLLGALVQVNMIRKTESAHYVAGPALVRWGGRLIARQDVRNVSIGFMEDLARKTGFVVNLARLDISSGEIVFMAKEQEGVFHTTVVVGSRMPIYSTALGKVLLAYAPMDARGRYLTSVCLEPRTSATVTDVGQLSEELDRVRIQGLAHDREENEQGVCAVAAPIRDYRGEVISALSVAMPTTITMAELRMVELDTMSTVQAISNELGWGE
ncbi:MAG: IclR family transcriptional regulator [Firmicutes bacterium]|nr:IclR family transcriptional regulator [Bacillota bacterium]